MASLTQTISLVACVWLELSYEASILATQRPKVPALLKTNVHILTSCTMPQFNHPR